MQRPTRAEVEAVNRLLYEELAAIRDRLATLLDDEDGNTPGTTSERLEREDEV